MIITDAERDRIVEELKAGAVYEVKKVCSGNEKTEAKVKYKYDTRTCYEAALAVIEEKYEANRLDNLVRVRWLQDSIQKYCPSITNQLLMAMVNALYDEESSKLSKS